MPTNPEREVRLAANIPWLISARWASLGVQAAAVAAGPFLLHIPLSAPLTTAGILAAAAASNAVAEMWTRSARARPRPGIVVGALLALDIALLTALLAVNGGAMNPLSILYLVYITTTAVMFRRAATWWAAIACVACFGSLLLLPWQGELVVPTDMAAHIDAMRLHVRSMWWSFLLAACMMGYFGSRLAERLDQQAAAVAAARGASDRNQRLASLATLAAGAAHELSTPLSTIAVVTEELDRALRREDARLTLIDDVALIRRELARCRAALDRLSVDAGQSPGEALVPISAGDVATAAIGLLGVYDRTRIRVTGDLEARLVAPPTALGQALANLLRNAAEAADSDQQVELIVRRADGYAAFVVRDRGAGMAPEIAERAGEPFFTTKAPGKGMGLGVFLSRAVAERLGGHLRFHSKSGEGTTAIIEVPSQS